MERLERMTIAATMIARGTPYNVAARAAGVDERTIRRWRGSSSDFARLLERARIDRMHADCNLDSWAPLTGLGPDRLGEEPEHAESNIVATRTAE
jgi:hypothetical protein